MSHPDRPESQIEFPKTNEEKNLDLLGTLHYVAAGITALFSCMFIVHIAMGLAMTADPQRTLPGFALPGLASNQSLAGTMFMVVGATTMVAGWIMAALLAYAGRCIRLRRGHLFCLVIAALSCLSLPLMPLYVPSSARSNRTRAGGRSVSDCVHHSPSMASGGYFVASGADLAQPFLHGIAKLRVVAKDDAALFEHVEKHENAQDFGCEGQRAREEHRAHADGACPRRLHSTATMVRARGTRRAAPKTGNARPCSRPGAG